MLLLAESTLDYLVYRFYGIIIVPRDFLSEQYSPEFYQTLDKRLSGNEPNLKRDPDVIIGDLSTLQPSGRASINGQIVDAQTDEPIIGATVFFPALELGASTDIEGRFQIEVPSGKYDMSLQYIGYEEDLLLADIIGDGTLKLAMEKEAINLKEVLVKAEGLDVNVESAQIGVEQLDVKSINKLPSFLGEVDVIRTLTFQ